MIALLFASLMYANTFTDTTVSWMEAKGLNPILIVLIISMLPIIELRGAIPVAILIFKMNWLEASVICIIGNMIPVPFILLLMTWFFRTISKYSVGKRFTEWLFARTRHKGKIIEKYEAIGLTAFVGIPLPGTGAWTGAFAANIFGLKFWKSILCIFLGVIGAAVIMTTLSVMGSLALG
jgi:uncharacterized membrane protein